MTETDTKMLTEFGAVVYELMGSRGIKSQVALARIMRDPEDHPVPKERLSAWLRKLNRPPAWVCRSISRALNLNQEEDIKLAVAFAFGSDVVARSKQIA